MFTTIWLMVFFALCVSASFWIGMWFKNFQWLQRIQDTLDVVRILKEAQTKENKENQHDSTTPPSDTE